MMTVDLKTLSQRKQNHKKGILINVLNIQV